jgi:hypothetical protein
MTVWRIRRASAGNRRRNPPTGKRPTRRPPTFALRGCKNRRIISPRPPVCRACGPSWPRPGSKAHGRGRERKNRSYAVSWGPLAARGQYSRLHAVSCRLARLIATLPVVPQGGALRASRLSEHMCRRAESPAIIKGAGPRLAQPPGGGRGHASHRGRPSGR